jgi:gluconolactonase
MKHPSFPPSGGALSPHFSRIPRRCFLKLGVAASGLTAFAPSVVAAERDWGSRQEPTRYPDPNVVVLDKRFAKYKITNTPIQRLWTGALWAEGCAWNAGGRYLVWSDIPNNRQMRRLEEDGHVSEFRKPSNTPMGAHSTLKAACFRAST